MAVQPRRVPFLHGDFQAVTAEMRRLTVHADGRQWMNIEPDVDRAEVHTGSLFWRMFSSRGPVIPRFTWVPAHTTKGRSVHCEVGILHATGRGAAERLTEHGPAIPAGWHLLQDHVKRGLLVAVPPDAGESAIVSWAVGALAVLSPFDPPHSFAATFYGEGADGPGD